MSQDLSKTQNSEIGQVEHQFNRAQLLIEKKLVPDSYKTPEQVVLAIAFGEQLGLDPISSVNSMDIIGGKPALQARMIPGLLARKNIAIEVIKDYEPVFEKKPTVVKDDDGKPVVDENGRIKYYRDEDGNIIYKEKEIDKTTIVKFIRYFPQIGRVDSEIKFNWTDAVRAGWTSKSNWSKMPQTV